MGRGYADRAPAAPSQGTSGTPHRDLKLPRVHSTNATVTLSLYRRYPTVKPRAPRRDAQGAHEAHPWDTTERGRGRPTTNAKAQQRLRHPSEPPSALSIRAHPRVHSRCATGTLYERHGYTVRAPRVHCTSAQGTLCLYRRYSSVKPWTPARHGQYRTATAPLTTNRTPQGVPNNRP